MPAPGAKEYSPEELARFRAEFAPVAKRYRKVVEYATLAILPLMLLMVAAFALPPWSWKPVVFIGFIVTVAAVMARVTPSLICPACTQKLQVPPAGHCPECGSATLTPGKWFSAPTCTTCGVTLVYSRGRRYKIRACTHCGVKLDDEGV